jgi:dihydroorotase
LTDAILVDPFRGRMDRSDIGIRDGHIVPLEAVADAPAVSFPGCWVVPRVTDLHVHLRDPGQTWKEDWESGLAAAAAGGVTVLGVMPNTVPVIDTPERLLRLPKGVRSAHVWPVAAVTRGQAGREPAPWQALAEAGARAFSDDGRAVADSGLLAAALRWSAASGCPIIQHLEDPALSRGGVAHDGPVARSLGLPGMPAAAESVLAWRDAALLSEVGGRLHFAHCSVPGTLEALAWAKARGCRITGEAAPHHLLLTDDALAAWHGSAVTKVNPPLRPREMRDQLRQAVRSGLIDAVASDHAPHGGAEKALPYVEAPFGISGLETLVSATVTVLGHELGTSPVETMRPLTSGPHRVMGEAYPGLVEGAPADLTVLDPEAEWVVDPEAFWSRGHNTPLAGLRLRGRVVATMVGGRFTFRDGEVTLA